jgi:hypothetical protein
VDAYGELLGNAFSEVAILQGRAVSRTYPHHFSVRRSTGSHQIARKGLARRPAQRLVAFLLLRPPVRAQARNTSETQFRSLTHLDLVHCGSRTDSRTGAAEGPSLSLAEGDDVRLDARIEECDLDMQSGIDPGSRTS